MKKYSRVCAYIDLDAIAYNMEQMKTDRSHQDRRIWSWGSSAGENV